MTVKRTPMDQATTLRQIVGRHKNDASTSRRSREGLRVIAITSGKGGVGKTNLVLNLAMALAMFISFLCAGVIGAGTPVLLKRVGIDPAVASSVIVITLVDIIGFFSFLGLAELLAVV